MGASEGLRSLFSYSSDPVFPLFSLQLRVLGGRYEFEYGRTVRLCLGCICPFQFRLLFLSYLFLYRILIPPLILPRSDFIHSLDIPSWIRVEGRLVRVSDTPYIDQQVVTIDQFTAAMASIQEALASLRQEIGDQQGRPPAVQDEAPYDSHPLPLRSFGASSITICITLAF